MFERRLKVVLALPIIAGIIIVARLYQIQITQGEAYVRKAEDALVSPKQFLPPLRGRILDRFGRVLVSDEPAHDVSVHYGVLSMNRSYLLRLADRIRKQEPRWRNAADSVREDEVKRRLEKMWLTLERLSGVSLMELRQRRDAHCRTVERWRRARRRRLRAEGRDVPLRDIRLDADLMFYPILRDVSPEVRTRIELELTDMPYVQVAPSVRRVWSEDADVLCHIVGRIGQASKKMIENDPRADDWLACYREDDLAGVSSIERVGEHMLRGKRGYRQHREGRLETHVPPIDGLDLQLTIDLDLQWRLTDILNAAVAGHPPSTGAACVVIDVDTREILAMVSVPTYDPEDLHDDYALLRDDARRRPLLFRAVAEEYQPGSILKPVALLAGFAHRLVDPARSVFCDGQLFPGAEKWHCWTHWRGLPGHGPLAAEEAIQHSCNVYFYGLGERINPKRLTDFYRAFIRGPDTAPSGSRGTGLVEERSGIIPTLDWMKSHRKRRFRPADGRNYAVGQGEIQLTPLQAANVFATLATGHYRDPTLIANDARDRPAVPIEGPSKSAWELTRRGLFRCVNELGGTAYKYARMESIEICGKTGSAQCVARVTRQRFTFPADDEPDQQSGPHEQPPIPNPQSPIPNRSVVAPTVEAAREALGLPAGAMPIKREVVERYPFPDPETGKISTHAWFAAYAPYREPRIAIAVVIEHGGSGGRTAAPVGRQIVETILESPREYLKDE